MTLSDSSKLQSNRVLKIVNDAHARGYAIPAICLYNLEGIIATVRAAETKRSPVLIQLFPWALEYASGLLVHAAAEAARNASVPIGVHLDHCQSPVMVRKAADIGGFDGIMVDMSHFEKEENMRLSKELVQYCHERGIVTECEPGRINGGEDGVLDTNDLDLEEVLTSPEQAEEFVELGIELLAPAFGNVHGGYGSKGPELDFERLAKVYEQVGDRVRFVLHGAHEDWFKEDLIRKCIDAGFVKFNLNSCVNNEFLRTQKELVGKVGLTTMIEGGTSAMQKVIETQMDWMMSAGKA